MRRKGGERCEEFIHLLTYLLTERPRGFWMPAERPGPLMVGPRPQLTAGTGSRRRGSRRREASHTSRPLAQRMSVPSTCPSGRSRDWVCSFLLGALFEKGQYRLGTHKCRSRAASCLPDGSTTGPFAPVCPSCLFTGIRGPGAETWRNGAGRNCRYFWETTSPACANRGRSRARGGRNCPCCAQRNGPPPLACTGGAKFTTGE